MRTCYIPLQNTLALITLSLAILLGAFPGQAQVGVCLVNFETCVVGTAFGTVQVTTQSDFQPAVPNTNAGRYNIFAVTEGNVYEWSLCPKDGAHIPAFSNTELTLRNAQGEFLCYSDDQCGYEPKIRWTATFTGEVHMQINQFYCLTNTASHTMVWRCASCGPVGIGEVISSAAIPVSAWPNPANDQLNLSFGTMHSGLFHYAIVDAPGREVLQGVASITPDQVLQLDISALSSGPYIFRGYMKDSYATQTFIKE